MDGKLSEVASIEAVKKSQNKKSKKKKRNFKPENDEYVESIREAKKLKEKFSSKKRAKDDDMAFLKVNANGMPKIQNSDTHSNLLKRAEEAQINRTFQIELRSDVIQTLWMCALCHQRSAQDELGDLFGPYYVNVRYEEQWPNFLLKKSLKLSKGETYCIDVWFHGDCLLWAPDIQMKGNQLTRLEERLHQFWKQSCWICKSSGASISVNNKFVHFPCAKKHGYKMDRHLLSIQS